MNKLLNVTLVLINRAKFLRWNATMTSSLLLMFIAIAFVGAGTRIVRADAPAQVRADTTPLWRFTTTSDITFFRLVSLDPPRLVVATKDALHFVDATTGKALWSRDDLRKVPAVHFDVMDAGSADPIRLARGIALADDVMHIFDLETGAKLAESDSWSVKSVCCYQPVYGNGLVLVIARTAGSENTLLGVELQSGAVRWRRELIFRKTPEMHEVPESWYTVTLSGNQHPLQVDSANLLLYLSKDGPFDINPVKGRIVWSGSVLKGKEVPQLAIGYAPMLVEGGVAYIPSKHTLVALNTSDGTPIWPSSPGLPGQIVQMEWTAPGLLVGGEGSPFLDLLDPATGRSLWRAPVTDLKDRSRFTVQGGTAYLAANNKLEAIDLASGAVRDIATVAFEGREQPYRVEMRPDGALLISDHNLLMLGTDGAAKYRRYYPAPTAGFFATLGSELRRNPGGDAFRTLGRALAIKASSPIALGATRLARDFVYIVTTAPDASGHQGVSLVRVNKADGAEAGRIWLTEKSFDYQTDPATDMVYLKQDSRAIVARQFDVGTSVPEKPTTIRSLSTSRTSVRSCW